MFFASQEEACKFPSTSCGKRLEKYNIDKKDLMVKMLHGIGKDAEVSAEDLDIGGFYKAFFSLNSKFTGTIMKTTLN